MSDNQTLYLKPNVRLEPLYNQWYAWPYLIPPAMAAMYITNLHLKVMKSYVMTPAVHAAALKNPAMRGGPFMDFQGKKVNEVRALLEKTEREQTHMVRFAEAVKQLNDMLLSEAKGHSLETLYEKVPEPLKGYVELVYDLNNNPSIRFIEGLLYRSPYFNIASQSVALSLNEGDERPFVFSTPRLEDEGHLQLSIPFSHAGIDALYKMRDVPQVYGYIKEILGVGNGDEERFRNLFTEEAPVRRPRYDGAATRVRYFGHASILVESGGVSLLTDPVISYEYDSAFFRYTYADLPETIDYVLITHTHADHCVFEHLLQLRHKTKNFVVPKSGGGALSDPSLKMILQSMGIKNVVEIDEMESIEFDGGTITALPFLGEHADLNVRTKTAHMITVNGKSIVCAADSSNLEPKLYEHVHNLTGDIDLLFVGMECEGAPMSWVYGALMTRPLERKMDQSRRFSGSDFDRAIQIVDQLNCQQVYVYAMGQEPWLGFLTSIEYTDESKPIVESNKLVEACQSRGRVSKRLFGSNELFL